MMSPGELKRRYPYQFSGPGAHWLAFATGWMPVIEAMCHQVDQVLHRHLERYAFDWVQFKEEFGHATFSYRLRLRTDEHGNEPATQEMEVLLGQLHAIRLQAQARAGALCMVCGAPGRLVERPWPLTLCQRHEDVRNRGEHHWSYLDDSGCEQKLR